MHESRERGILQVRVKKRAAAFRSLEVAVVEVALAANGRSAVITPPDELWLATTASFTAAVVDLVEAGVTDVTVDLEHVSLLCSAGVHAIVGCHQLVAINGGSLHIRNAHGVVDRVVELTELRGLLV